MKTLTIAKLAELMGYNNPTTLNNWKAAVKSKNQAGEITYDETIKDRYEMARIGGLLFVNGFTYNDAVNIIEAIENGDNVKEIVELKRIIEKMQDTAVEVGAMVENLKSKKNAKA